MKQSITGYIHRDHLPYLVDNTKIKVPYIYTDKKELLNIYSENEIIAVRVEITEVN